MNGVIPDRGVQTFLARRIQQQRTRKMNDFRFEALRWEPEQVACVTATLVRGNEDDYSVVYRRGCYEMKGCIWNGYGPGPDAMELELGEFV